MDYDVPPPFREKFLNDSYLDSFVNEGSAAPHTINLAERPMPSKGGASTVLAAVHLPTSLWVVGETLRTPASGVPHAAISHIEVAGVAILTVSAALALVELVRQGVISCVELAHALGIRPKQRARANRAR